jgi:hypothetical protein
MRRFLQVGLGVWFAIVMSWTQACVAPTQAAGSDPAAIISSPLGKVGNDPNAADPPSGYESASNAAGSHVDTRRYNADQGESQALTQYLKAHRLPLVGAQVLDGPGSKRAVVLYGFVGTDFGKSDAAAKSQRFLAGPSVLVDNRIKVRPELLASGGVSAPPASSSPTSGSPSADTGSEANNSSYPGADSYVQEQNQYPAVQQYQQQQQQGSAMSTAMLIGMIAIMGLSMASGGGVSVGPGSMGPPGGFPPFGPPGPYNPYPGYPSPGSPGYPSSSGSPFGSYP